MSVIQRQRQTLQTELLNVAKRYIETALIKLKQIKGLSISLSDIYIMDNPGFFDPCSLQTPTSFILTLTFVDPLHNTHEIFKCALWSSILEEYIKDTDPQNLPITEAITLRIVKNVFDCWKNIMKDRGYDYTNYINPVAVAVDARAIDPTYSGAYAKINVGAVTVSKLDTLSDVITDTRQEFEDKIQTMQDENDRLKDELDRLKSMTNLLLDKCAEKGII